MQQGDPLGPLLFSSVLHPLARKIEAEFPDLDLCVWYLDGTIIGQIEDVQKVFLLFEQEGPALGLHLNVKKNESWWPSRTSVDPFPAEVERIENVGVKLLGAAIGTKAFTTDFVKKKLKALGDVCKALREVQRTSRVRSVQRLLVLQQNQSPIADLSSRSARRCSRAVR